MAGHDPQKVESFMHDTEMSILQYTTIFVCFLLNMLDGMDVLVISYAASSIAEEWSISMASLGAVFSAGLVGMAFGAMFLAPIADTIGRKKMILICALIMGLSIYMTSFASSLIHIILLRLISGLGIGAMLASTTTLLSEYAAPRSKPLWVGIGLSGYPLGAFLTGMVAAEVIPAYGWRSIFEIAGIATLSTIPLILFMMSESLDYLIKKRPRGAIIHINRILNRMGRESISEMPVLHTHTIRTSVRSLFSKALKPQTILLWAGFFSAYATLYFMMSWIPKLAETTGLSKELAIYAGAVFNLGAIGGVAIHGFLAGRWGLRNVILIFFLFCAFLMMIFGFFAGSIVTLVLFGIIGFFLQGGFIGFYSVAAQLYPAEVRTTGVGWAIGAGRSGAVVGPYLGGILIGMEFSIGTNFFIFAIPCIIAGIIAKRISSVHVS